MKYYVLSLSMLLSVVFFGSCQTDLVTPQTDNTNMAVSQNLTVPNNNNSLEQSENESPIIGKIVARRDQPETWDDLGTLENREYYAQVFAENPEVGGIFHNQECDAFGAIVGPIGTSEEGGIIIAVDRNDSNLDSDLGFRMIRQPNERPWPTCLEWLTIKILVLCTICRG